MTAPNPGAGPGSRHELLAEAVRVLTQAARLTRPVLARDETASTPEQPVWVESGKREQDDFAEFLTHAVAGAAPTSAASRVSSRAGRAPGKPTTSATCSPAPSGTTRPTCSSTAPNR